MTVDSSAYEKIRILNSDRLYRIMVEVLKRENEIDQDKEHFWVIGLANDCRLLFIELIGLGTVNGVLVKPMEVFSVALQKRAVNIIVVHNHPSGNLTPSKSDEVTTARLIRSGRIVETPVFDHLIITLEGFLSFKDIGLMKKLEDSDMFLTTREMEMRAKEKVISEVLPDKLLNMAKEMKRKGVPDEDIALYTEIPLEEVRSLRVRRKK